MCANISSSACQLRSSCSAESFSIAQLAYVRLVLKSSSNRPFCIGKSQSDLTKLGVCFGLFSIIHPLIVYDEHCACAHGHGTHISLAASFFQVMLWPRNVGSNKMCIFHSCNQHAKGVYQFVSFRCKVCIMVSDK